MAAKELAKQLYQNMRNPCIPMSELKGKAVLGRIVYAPMRSNFAEVDVGLPSTTTVPKRELGSPEEVKVGQRQPFVLEYLWTPFQQPQVVPMKTSQALRETKVWVALKEKMNEGKPVRGRMLNLLSGGWAVGIAGHVAFMPMSHLPLSQGTSKLIGKLLNFKILNMRDDNRNIIVSPQLPSGTLVHSTSESQSQPSTSERRPGRSGSKKKRASKKRS